MSSNIENDGVVGLKNDDLDCDDLAMVVDYNCEFNYEGKTYRSNTDYVQAKQSPTAGIFTNSGMLAAGSSSMTTRRSSLLYHPGSTDGTSPAGSLLVSSGDGGDDREDGADSVTAAAFAAAFAARDKETLTHEEVMFGVPEVDYFGAMVERVVFDNVENGTTKTSSYHTLIESHNDTKTEEEDDDARKEDARVTTARGGFDSVSSSIGSLERCIYTINTSLSSWSPESRNFLSDFAKNIKPKNTIYWVQGLCPNREKSLALGTRGLDGLDRASCPSANFNDRVLEPVAERLRAKMIL